MTNLKQQQEIERESFAHGAKRTIKVPVIAEDNFIQYSREHPKLASVIGTYGICNFIHVTNRDEVDIEIALDFTENKTYPVQAGSSITIDEIQYQELNIVNLDTDASTKANKIIVVIGFEPPLIRDRKFTSLAKKQGWKVLRW